MPKVSASTIDERKKKISVTKSEKKRKSLKQVNALKATVHLTDKKPGDELKTNYVALNQTKISKCLNNTTVTKTPSTKVNAHLTNKKPQMLQNAFSKPNTTIAFGTNGTVNSSFKPAK